MNTHYHTINYVQTLLAYLEEDIAQARKELKEEDHTPEWKTYQMERIYGYESSKRYLEGVVGMAKLEQEWNSKSGEKKE